MAWDGFYEYAGTPIINVQRTERYAKHLPWFKAVYKNTSLGPMLGETYTSPILDRDLPWGDPNDPASYEFYGAYPVSITGIEDSTRTSTVTANVGDGGFVTSLRHDTKSPVFNVVLVGENDAACEYGVRWLKQALMGGQCDTGLPPLCYLASEPQTDPDAVDYVLVDSDAFDVIFDGGDTNDGLDVDIDGGDTNDGGAGIDGGGPNEGQTLVGVTTTNVTGCLDPLLRSLHQVQFNSGPTVTAKYDLNGGAAWNITFSGVAQEPWEYGAEVEVIKDFLRPGVTNPWVGDVPTGGHVDLDGALYSEKSCKEVLLAPLEDPLCPITVAPPLPPSVGLGCFELPANWRRRQITIPSTYIPLWGEVVPKFQVHARTHDLRYLRLRFYADPEEDGSLSTDPCSFCGDLVISYIPKGYTLVFDTSERQVYVIDATQRRRRADAVVFAADGGPFDWPVLTCGTGYVVTLDLPQTQHPPVFDLSFYSRAA